MRREILVESVCVARERQEVIRANRVDVLRETRDNATGRVETDDGIVGVTVQDRKERVVS